MSHVALTMYCHLPTRPQHGSQWMGEGICHAPPGIKLSSLFCIVHQGLSLCPGCCVLACMNQKSHRRPKTGSSLFSPNCAKTRMYLFEAELKRCRLSRMQHLWNYRLLFLVFFLTLDTHPQSFYPQRLSFPNYLWKYILAGVCVHT